MLEQLEQALKDIRAVAHDVLKNVPALGTIWKPHPDEDWRVEISDAGSKVRQPGPGVPNCPDCPEMVVVPAGRFTMGSPEGEQGRYDDEGPQHEVVR